MIEGTTEVDNEKLSEIISEMNNESQLDYPSGGGGYVSDYDSFISIMGKISNEHGGFLKNDIVNIGRIFPISFTNNDSDYSELLTGYMETQYTHNQVDQNGAVEETGSSTSGGSYSAPSTGDYSSGDVSPEISNSDYNVGAPEKVPSPDNYKTNLSPNVNDNISSTAALRPSSSNDSFQARLSSPSDSSKSSLKNSLTGATAGGVAGGAAAVGSALTDAISSIKSKTNNPSILEHNDYLLGNYDCSNIVDSLDEEQAKNVTEVLKECGCSDEEVDAILNGDYTVSEVLVESVSDELNGLIDTNPGIRQEIIDQYGIDVFNDDGTVNDDKLSLALCIDDLNGKDNYSMINMLSTNYGVNLVDSNKLSEYTKKMEDLLLSDFSIKEKIKKEYGFDLFNSDGTINTDRLTLAMLIDSKRTDGRTIDNILDNVSISNVGYGLASNIKGIGVKSTNSNSSSGVKTVGLALSAAAGVTAAAGFGAKKVIDKKKENQNESEQVVNPINNQIDVNNDNTDDKKYDNSWIYDVIND